MISCDSVTQATGCFKGYAIFNGQCFKCGTGCKECSYDSVLNNTTCTKCASKFILDAEICSSCSDVNCEKCSEAAYCTTCIKGYVGVDGVCKACS